MRADGADGRTAAIGEMRRWLCARNPTLAMESIADDTDLVDTRKLSSLQVVEFVLFVEELSGRSILREGLDMNVFRTLAGVYRTFFAPAADGAGR